MPVLGVDTVPAEPRIWVAAPDDLNPKIGTPVVLGTPDGEESGVIQAIEEQAEVSAEHSFLRLAGARDMQIIEENNKRGPISLKECSAIVSRHALPMQLVRAHYSFSGRKLTFIYTAEDRVDFRELLKDLAKTFKRQIRLKQIGPRDRAKLLGGFGKCGRELCCSTWLSQLDSVTMDMVRVQGMASRGAAKVSGLCGKLMCCMAYEVEQYAELYKNLPEAGTTVRIAEGTGVVISHDILNQKIKLRLKDPTDQDRYELMVVDVEDIIKKGQKAPEDTNKSKKVIKTTIDMTRPAEQEEKPEKTTVTTS